ncbi:MAG: hypothetical protein HIU83_16790 [Proteobacteria bacterium]|nr:hypothetical protein [Pseudomonadota bacterium]
MPDGLSVLLELNGYTYRLDKGFWVKFEAYLVNATDHIPHGISYSITLHDRHNKRIVGFDNAHGFSPPSRRKKFGCRKVTWDHKHNCEKVSNYDYESAAQLIEDFWEEVGKVV